MVLARRYCVDYVDGTTECFREGFWYSTTGVIVKWAILAGFFLFFVAWFGGGYVHAKSRMKKGKPLLRYHRFLVSYDERKKYGQTPQNHFTFYATQPQPYQYHYGSAGVAQRPDGTWPEPPPMYTGDAPPGYGGPPPPMGATKTNPNQGPGAAMEMPQYGFAPQPMGPAQGEQPQQNQDLPPRPPQQAKVAFTNFVSRFRR